MTVRSDSRRRGLVALSRHGRPLVYVGADHIVRLRNIPDGRSLVAHPTQTSVTCASPGRRTAAAGRRSAGATGSACTPGPGSAAPAGGGAGAVPAAAGCRAGPAGRTRPAPGRTGDGRAGP